MFAAFILLHGSTILVVPAGIFFVIAFLLLAFAVRKKSYKTSSHWDMSVLLALVFAFAGLVCFLIALDEIRYWIKYSLHY